MRFTHCSWNATSILCLISASWSLFLSLCFSHLLSTPVPLRVRLWVPVCLPGTGVLLFIPIWWLRPYSLTQNTYLLTESYLATDSPNTHQLLDFWELCSSQYQHMPLLPTNLPGQTFLEHLPSATIPSKDQVLLQDQIPGALLGSLSFCTHSLIFSMPNSSFLTQSITLGYRVGLCLTYPDTW